MDDPSAMSRGSLEIELDPAFEAGTSEFAFGRADRFEDLDLEGDWRN